ncbi:MAG: cytochrome P450 [Pseudomonadota bacterium]
MQTIELNGYRACEKALLEPDLKQALYDEGAILMKEVLVTLHGDKHRERRVLEMRVFRRNFFRHYEHDIIPSVFEKTVKPFIEDGRADVVELGYRVMVNLAITFAGIDLPAGTKEEHDDLVRMLRVFGTAATLAQSKLDREETKREIRRTLDEFDEKFFAASVERRQALLDDVKAGRLSEDDLPMDILTVLLRNEDSIDLSRDMVLRETAFFFLAGAHTSVHSLGHAMHHILTWCDEHPGDRDKLIGDTALLQRFVHESFRLHPSSPASWRTALAPVEFLSGETAESGDRVIVNLQIANRDPEIFGDDAAEFAPGRTLPRGVTETGITFGIGIHSCLGRNLAAGTLPRDGEEVAPERRQLGMVAWIAHALLKAGARKDPDKEGYLDPTITRETWAEYPIVFRGD